MKRWALIRSILIFLGGLGLAIHAGLAGNLDYTQAFLYAAMMGLPVFLASDEKNDKEDDE